MLAHGEAEPGDYCSTRLFLGSVYFQIHLLSCSSRLIFFCEAECNFDLSICYLMHHVISKYANFANFASKIKRQRLHAGGKSKVRCEELVYKDKWRKCSIWMWPQMSRWQDWGAVPRYHLFIHLFCHAEPSTIRHFSVFYSILTSDFLIFFPKFFMHILFHVIFCDCIGFQSHFVASCPVSFCF